MHSVQPHGQKKICCETHVIFFGFVLNNFGCLVWCISSINAALRGTNKNTHYVEVVTSNFF